MKAKTLGTNGENLAAHYLQSKGYEILKNNFTVRGGEIDLVTKQDNTLVFVEVKTRTSSSFGYGDESMNRLKKMRIHRAIQRYLGDEDTDYRVDLVEIQLEPDKNTLKTINHFEDIDYE